MNLKDFLGTLDSEITIHLGSSSGYFFIGRPKEIEDNNYAINKDLLSKKIHCIGLSATHIANGKLAKAKNTGDFNRTCKTLQNSINELENFVPILERKVIDSYQLIDEGHCAVILEGREIGEFWNLKEWETAQIKNKGKRKKGATE